MAEEEGWPERWAQILSWRDQMSCRQAGRHGPPFADRLSPRSWAERWLPWHWFSLDGRGWCYDAEWDELVRCGELDGVDWNGIRTPGRHGAAHASRLLGGSLLCCAACALLAWYAYSEWLSQARKESAHAGVAQWVRSRACLPWNWRRPARLALLGHLCAWLLFMD
ncbi:hypothetical protein AB1Y20_023079 [Prymnesium parvum]|uniref:Uncharacterized protein n=1 Tax=Prymnesium parvum TaxID=97485 RepID=A0AB34JFC7_PRYPA